MNTDSNPALPADPIIWRDDLRVALNNISNETVRRWLKSNRLPKPDIFPTRQTMGWKMSTLKQAGFDLGTSTERVSASV